MTRPELVQSGFAGADLLISVGAAQRASLGRGLAFALVLAISSLLVVYAPLAAPRHVVTGVAAAAAGH